jgi:hypothetical protein
MGGAGQEWRLAGGFSRGGGGGAGAGAAAFGGSGKGGVGGGGTKSRGTRGFLPGSERGADTNTC